MLQPGSFSSRSLPCSVVENGPRTSDRLQQSQAQCSLFILPLARRAAHGTSGAGRAKSAEGAMPDFAIENGCRGVVCGVDEAGRGPLAGPVVAAAVIIDRARFRGELRASARRFEGADRATRARSATAALSALRADRGRGGERRARSTASTSCAPACWRCARAVAALGRARPTSRWSTATSRRRCRAR